MRIADDDMGMEMGTGMECNMGGTEGIGIGLG